MNSSDVTIVVTNCLRPDFTIDALQSIRTWYEDIRIILVDDHCKKCESELLSMEKFDITILRNRARVGCGKALDRGFREADTKFVVSCEHGVRLKKGGIIEYLFDNDIYGDAVGVGRERYNNAGARLLGSYVDPIFALWDREFIVDNDLSFVLADLHLPDGKIARGCSTGQYLCYRAGMLGRRTVFVNELTNWMWHCRDKNRTRGMSQSPHSSIYLKKGEIDVPP
ncbi:MAG: glycosyltransferase [Candidatus Thorarchaeota archaeon]